MTLLSRYEILRRSIKDPPIKVECSFKHFIMILECCYHGQNPSVLNFIVYRIKESEDINELSFDELQSSLLVREKTIIQQDRKRAILEKEKEIVNQTSQIRR